MLYEPQRFISGSLYTSLIPHQEMSGDDKTVNRTSGIFFQPMSWFSGRVASHLDFLKRPQSIFKFKILKKWCVVLIIVLSLWYLQITPLPLNTYISNFRDLLTFTKP